MIQYCMFQEMASNQPKVLNLDEAISTWAWREYDRTATKKQRQLREKEAKKKTKIIELHIDWSSVQFHDETHWAPLREEAITEKDKDDENKNENTMKTDEGLSHCSTLFQTSFTNNTGDDQEYTLRTQKTTCSTATTEIESCLTKGVEMQVCLKSPGEIFEANAGYSRELSLSNAQGQTFEEVLEWGVESQIKVKKHHIAEASLVVNEKKYGGDFQIESHVWGMVYVTFTNLRDNNALVKATGHEITEIVKEYIEKENRKGVSFPFVKATDERVEVTTKGQCKFRYGIKQEVVVNQKPI